MGETVQTWGEGEAKHGRIVLGVLSLVPLIGLLVLLVVNGKATNILRQNDIKVGLLGAKDISAI